MDKRKIRHNPNQQIFFISLDFKLGYLRYELPEDGIIEFTQTFVPEKHRNKGIAGQLVDQGLEYAAQMDLKVRPSCPYVRSYIEQHPETKILLEEQLETVNTNNS